MPREAHKGGAHVGVVGHEVGNHLADLGEVLGLLGLHKLLRTQTRGLEGAHGGQKKGRCNLQLHKSADDGVGSRRATAIMRMGERSSGVSRKNKVTRKKCAATYKEDTQAAA